MLQFCNKVKFSDWAKNETEEAKGKRYQDKTTGFQLTGKWVKYENVNFC